MSKGVTLPQEFLSSVSYTEITPGQIKMVAMAQLKTKQFALKYKSPFVSSFSMPGIVLKYLGLHLEHSLNGFPLTSITTLGGRYHCFPDQTDRCGKWNIEHSVTCPRSAVGKWQKKMKEGREE